MTESQDEIFKSCFVICPLGDEDSDSRIHSDRVLRHIIQEPCAKEGFNVTRSDQLPDPGIITHQIVQHLANDELVIADLSFHNPNVYYELAVRHATRKPFIQIIRAEEQIPFDLAGLRTFQFQLSNPDSIGHVRSAFMPR